jgi:predicted DNA-binding transcriptional regulator YafY
VIEDRRVDRRAKLLTHLKVSDFVSAQTLADELEVNVRTIYRDIEELLQAGAPIQGVPGPDGGYRLESSNAVAFKNEEAARAYLETLHSEVPARTDDALFKFAAGFDYKTGGLISDGRLLFDTTVEPQFFDEADRIARIQTALRDSEAITLHRSRCQNLDTKSRPSEEVVVPLGLVFRSGEWFLVAKTLAGQIMSEPVVDLDSINLTGLTFPWPEGFQLNKWWNDHLAILKSDGTAVTILIINPSHSLLRRLAQRTILVRRDELNDGSVRVVLSTNDCDWLISVLSGYGDEIVLEEPLHLRQKLRKLFEVAAARHGKADQ